jgi:phosphatidylethanolamine-binding protein (PEBP) family uncharacterized protein
MRLSGKGIDMLHKAVIDAQSLRLCVVALSTLVRVGTARMAMSKPPHHFVLMSPDARLAVSVPEIYTAQAFGCSGGNQSPALQWSGAPPDLGTDVYHRPCPAKADPPHRYVFTVCAANVAKLPDAPEASGAMVTSAVLRPPAG